MLVRKKVFKTMQKMNESETEWPVRCVNASTQTYLYYARAFSTSSTNYKYAFLIIFGNFF